MLFISVSVLIYKGVVSMPVILNLQVLRKNTKYASYRISLPKDIIEAKHWENVRFKLELKEGNIVLKPIK